LSLSIASILSAVASPEDIVSSWTVPSPPHMRPNEKKRKIMKNDISSVAILDGRKEMPTALLEGKEEGDFDFLMQAREQILGF